MEFAAWAAALRVFLGFTFHKFNLGWFTLTTWLTLGVVIVMVHERGGLLKYRKANKPFYPKDL